ncbi:MAG: hypothetical protein R3B90_04020 [Planctomycetaceae bacterium]
MSKLFSIAEHDVEKIDRPAPRSPISVAEGGDFVVIDAQGIHERFADLIEDFI